MRRGQVFEAEILYPERAPAPGTGRDDEFYCPEAPDRAAARRAPRELDLPSPEPHLAPRILRRECLLAESPDVLSRRVDQFELEDIRRRVPAEPEAEGEGLREPAPKWFPGRREAPAANEIKIHAERIAPGAGAVGEIEADLARGEGEPSFGIAETIHRDAPVGNLWSGSDGLAKARHVVAMMPVAEPEASRFGEGDRVSSRCHRDVTG